MNSSDTIIANCPLRYQTGDVAIQNFDALLEHLSLELRAAFENEREERQYEFDNYMATNEYLT